MTLAQEKSPSFSAMILLLRCTTGMMLLLPLPRLSTPPIMQPLEITAPVGYTMADAYKRVILFPQGSAYRCELASQPVTILQVHGIPTTVTSTIPLRSLTSTSVPVLPNTSGGITYTTTPVPQLSVQNNAVIHQVASPTRNNNTVTNTASNHRTNKRPAGSLRNRGLPALRKKKLKRPASRGSDDARI